MELDHWVLDGHDVKPATLMEWAAQFEKADARTVAKDDVGDAHVSTVFLGIDHNFGGGPPHLFETMVFGGAHDQDTERYATWDAAEAGHRAVVQQLTDESAV